MVACARRSPADGITACHELPVRIKLADLIGEYATYPFSYHNLIGGMENAFYGEKGQG
jgi:hypothetical protein